MYQIIEKKYSKIANVCYDLIFFHFHINRNMEVIILLNPIFIVLIFLLTKVTSIFLFTIDVYYLMHSFLLYIYPFKKMKVSQTILFLHLFYSIHLWVLYNTIILTIYMWSMQTQLMLWYLQHQKQKSTFYIWEKVLT